MNYKKNGHEDFWKRVNKDGPTQTHVKNIGRCWNWTGGISDKGYGTYTIGYKKWVAHRLAYIIMNGAIQNGLLCCHKCDNRLCVRPAHLFLGTAGDNARDAVSKGRITTPRLPGEKHPHSILTEEQVIEIFHRPKTHSRTLYEIAEEFGVAYKTVWGIRNAIWWKHITSKLKQKQ